MWVNIETVSIFNCHQSTPCLILGVNGKVNIRRNKFSVLFHHHVFRSGDVFKFSKTLTFFDIQKNNFKGFNKIVVRSIKEEKDPKKRIFYLILNESTYLKFIGEEI
jgi:hypothetical protein